MMTSRFYRTCSVVPLAVQNDAQPMDQEDDVQEQDDEDDGDEDSDQVRKDLEELGLN